MDPSARRARNVVLLVVSTVAVPSLLLTALAGVAVQNEEAAAQQRLHKQAQPAMDALAARFNSLVDALVAAADSRLVHLAAWAEAAPGMGAPDLAAPPIGTAALNPFVVDSDGEVLVPRRPEHGEDPATPLPADLREALAFELSHEGQPVACDRYRELPENASGASSPRDCTARLALLLCESGGVPAPNWKGALGPVCDDHAGEAIAARAFRLRELAAQRAQCADPFLDEAERLVGQLASPAYVGSAWLAELVARDTALRLRGVPGRRAERVGNSLVLISERAALLSALSNASHSRDPVTTSGSMLVKGSQRVLVSRPVGGSVAGFELVGNSLEEPLNESLCSMVLPVPARAALVPISPLPGLASFDWHKFPDKVIGDVFLKKTGIAWALALVYDEGPSAVASLVATRSRLYVWAIALLLLALVTGLVYTVRSVILEARQSRLKVDFVSSVSHDLRTPLTSIRMFTETLLMGRVRSREEERECLSVIAQETERLSRLAQRILDFSRMEAGRKAYEPRPEPLAGMVRDSLAACRPLIEEGGFKVEVELSPEAAAVVVDRDAMVEVLINLITNAVKYSPGERFLRIASRRAGDRIELSVADRGIGIARAEQARIFEKFYRVDCRRTTEVGGCGIGLSLVSHIVKAHRGEVRVDSEPGRGSTFTVTLPAPAPAAGEAPAGLAAKLSGGARA